MEELTKFDVAEYLDTDELQTLYLDEVAKENDPSALIKAIDTVARAKGMTKTAGSGNFQRRTLQSSFPEWQSFFCNGMQDTERNRLYSCS